MPTASTRSSNLVSLGSCMKMIVSVLLLLSLMTVAATATTHDESSTTKTTKDTTTPPRKSGPWQRNPHHEIGEYMVEAGYYQSIQLLDYNDEDNDNKNKNKNNNNNNNNNNNPAVLYEETSDFQHIQILQSSLHFGKILVLDGVVQLTERDADAYNEIMAHLPLFQHANPRRVLVIGGGDGYVVSEVLKHASVTHVDHVDLDGRVVAVCQEYFPWGAAWRKDDRAHLHIADGAAFVAAVESSSSLYDVIIQDSSDPSTWDDNGQEVPLPSGVLYAQQHFQNLYRALSPAGILVLQAETMILPSDLQAAARYRRELLQVGFAQSRYASVLVSSYPTGQIGVLMAEKDPAAAATPDQVRDRFVQMRQHHPPTTYYQPKLQTSIFDLPLWAERVFYGTTDFDDDDEAPVCDNDSSAE